MDLISEFIKQYNQKYDYYRKLAEIVWNKLEKELFNAWIKCIVSYRAKTSSSLLNKLKKRSIENWEYKSFEQIYNDINDFSWVRIALYFPSDIKIVSGIVENIFIKINDKNFPETDSNNWNRFSWYWAKHYRVELKKEKGLEERFLSSKVEIQIASLLMHAWAEVEHDIRYKPFTWEITSEEKAILDEINWLVLVWEIALERLQEAINYKISKSKQNEITNNYETYNLISPYFKWLDNTKGNIRDINKFLFEFNEKLKVNELSKTLNEVNKTIWIGKLNDSINKLANNVTLNSYLNLLMDAYIKNDLNKSWEKLNRYLRIKYNNSNNITYFEKFIRFWIIFENLLDLYDGWLYKKFKTLWEWIEFLDKNENIIFRDIRGIRNTLIHWKFKNYDKLWEFISILSTFIKKWINDYKRKNWEDKNILNLEKEFNKYEKY